MIFWRIPFAETSTGTFFSLKRNSLQYARCGCRLSRWTEPDLMVSGALRDGSFSAQKTSQMISQMWGSRLATDDSCSYSWFAGPGHQGPHSSPSQAWWSRKVAPPEAGASVRRELIRNTNLQLSKANNLVTTPIFHIVGPCISPRGNMVQGPGRTSAGDPDPAHSRSANAESHLPHCAWSKSQMIGRSDIEGMSLQPTDGLCAEIGEWRSDREAFISPRSMVGNAKRGSYRRLDGWECQIRCLAALAPQSRPISALTACRGAVGPWRLGACGVQSPSPAVF